MTVARPDVDALLANLTDFQRTTVDHVVARMFDPVDPAPRFLVADEVGLGKTFIARGVVARTIDRLWDEVERIDVVYICSNSQIARQNLRRLNVYDDSVVSSAERLTMLPTVTRELAGRRVNLVSFTPGTSFNVTRGGGHAPERVVLFWLLAGALDDSLGARKWRHFMRVGSGLVNFERELGWFDRSRLDPTLVSDFATALHEAPGPRGGLLVDELRACVEKFTYMRATTSPSSELYNDRTAILGALRTLVARLSMRRLEPDLVILDEFQRFTNILSGESDAARLAQDFFNVPGRAR